MHLDNYACVLCVSLDEETVTHLFADCPFARMCWDSINVEIPLNCSFPELVPLIRNQLNSQFFMETIIIFCWALWTARNGLIFRGERFHLIDVRRVFFKELRLLQHRVKPGQENICFHGFKDWNRQLP